VPDSTAFGALRGCILFNSPLIALPPVPSFSYLRGSWNPPPFPHSFRILPLTRTLPSSFSSPHSSSLYVVFLSPSTTTTTTKTTMMMFPIKFSAALLFFALGVSAAPVQNSVHLAKRDVWSPKITSPTKGAVWCEGSTVSVTWDTSNPPAQVTDPSGTIFLGYELSGGSGGENLDVDHPLASGFPLSQGQVSFKVPYVKHRDSYIVVLMGDSGNGSEEFTIKKCK